MARRKQGFLSSDALVTVNPDGGSNAAALQDILFGTPAERALAVFDRMLCGEQVSIYVAWGLGRAQYGVSTWTIHTVAGPSSSLRVSV